MSVQQSQKTQIIGYSTSDIDLKLQGRDIFVLQGSTPFSSA